MSCQRLGSLLCYCCSRVSVFTCLRLLYLTSVVPEGSLLRRCCQSGFALWAGLKSCSRCTGPGPFYVRVSGTD